MDQIKQYALQAVDDHQKLLCRLSDQIWEFSELSLYEYKSADLYCKILAQEGFRVERGLCGIATAFSGTFGQGSPVIGIAGEFDALSGLSQVAGSTVQQAIIPGAAGQGCGHNLLGAGSLGAAISVKRYLEQTGASGTVIFYGCPGEEGGAAKAFMARDNIWRQLDAAFCWHPNSVNEVSTGTTNSCIQTEYRFTGTPSHAAAEPYLGRSALDAVELMNIGVQFLREHMPDGARIHYAITDSGGNSPNVVQSSAQVLYMVRSCEVSQALTLQARVDKIAKAAADMTETTMQYRFIDGCSNVIPNYTLAKLLYKNFEQIGVPEYTPEETQYAAELLKSYYTPQLPLPGFASIHDPGIGEMVRERTSNGTLPLNDFLMPYYESTLQTPGSTDVGDVSWQTPTAQIGTVCFASNSPGHSWQNVSCGRTTIGYKGLLSAAKVLAGAVIDILRQPEILTTAKEEFRQKTKAGYHCPVPPNAPIVALGDPFDL